MFNFKIKYPHVYEEEEDDNPWWNPFRRSSMTRFLFFATGDGMDAANDAFIYPLHSLRGIHPVNATTVALRFTPMFITDVATGDATDLVTLTIASGRFKEVVKDFLKSVQYDFNVMVDSDNNEFFSRHVSDCSVTLAT